jgi:hypothetical protein
VLLVKSCGVHYFGTLQYILMLVFSHLENYMQSLYPNIHSAPDDWVALTAAAAVPYLPSTKESVHVGHLTMKSRVMARPQKAVEQWHRLKLFEALVIEGKVAKYSATFVIQHCLRHHLALNFKLFPPKFFPT